jgi:type I restriction enzyme S subunit
MTPDDLKKSILQLAIQGKLVPQLPEEESAEDLYKAIQKEKQALVKSGKIKKEKDLSPITEDEIPFDIPDSWKWVRIGEIFNLQAGKNITSSNIFDTKSPTHQFLCYGGNGVRGYVSDFNRDGHFAIIGRQGALCGNINVANGRFYATEHAVVVEHFGMSDVLWGSFFLEALKLNQYATATAQPGLAVANIVNVLIPLPPLAEQKRIVAKIEELLPLVDQYGKAWEQLEQLNKAFPDDLKKSILQFAIQGKLVPQLPEEGSADDLYKAIQKEKQGLVKSGKIKKEKALSPITEDELPFDIPDSWVWVRLDHLVTKTIKRGKSPKYAPSSQTLVFAQKCNTKAGSINLDLAQFLDDAVTHKYPIEEYMVDQDIMVNSTGGGTLGRVGFFHETDNPRGLAVVPDSHVTVIRISQQLHIPFFFYCLKFFQPVLEKLGSGSTNQTELNVNTLKNFPIPLPPLSEQKRIVAKIEELLTYCDRIKF